RLLEEAIQRASEAGWHVLADGCHRYGGQEPYAPLLGAIARHLHRQSLAEQRQAVRDCAWLALLLPELREQQVLSGFPAPLPPAQERRLMFAAVERFLSNVSGPMGTLLVLDDLQWASADALDLLATLVRSAPHTP